MTILFSAATSDRLEYAANAFPFNGSNTAFTIALFVHRTLVPSAVTGLFSLRNGANIRLLLQSPSSSTTYQLTRGAATTNGVWSIADLFPLDTDVFCCVQSDGVNTPRIWSNGVERSLTQVTAQVGATAGNINRLIVGNSLTSNSSRARIGEFGLWESALPVADCLALSRGISPQTVNPGSPIYMPLIDAASPFNINSSIQPSLTGSAAAAHPATVLYGG